MSRELIYTYVITGFSSWDSYSQIQDRDNPPPWFPRPGLVVTRRGRPATPTAQVKTPTGETYPGEGHYSGRYSVPGSSLESYQGGRKRDCYFFAARLRLVSVTLTPAP